MYRATIRGSSAYLVQEDSSPAKNDDYPIAGVGFDASNIGSDSLDRARAAQMMAMQNLIHARMRRKVIADSGEDGVGGVADGSAMTIAAHAVVFL